MSIKGVDANYRFIAASNEINARIAQRQQALALFVTLTVSLLAALVALKPETGGSHLPVEWLVMGFPVSSLCLAFLNYRTERAITHLRHFLSTLERVDDMHKQLPSYNADPQWAMGANAARRFHDYTAAVLVLGGNAIGLGAVIKIYPQRMAENQIAIWIALVIAVVSLASLLLTPRWSYKTTE